MTRTKLLAVSAVLAFALPLTACGSDDKEKPESGSSSQSNPFGGGSEESPSEEPTEDATSDDVESDEPTSDDSESDEPTDGTDPGDGGFSRATVIDEMTKAILGSSGGAFKITEDEARCTSETMIDGIGIKRLAELGQSGTMDLSTDEANQVADAMVDCGAITTAKVKKVMEDSLGGADSMPGLDGCLDESITDDLIREMALAGLTGGDSAALGQTLGTDLTKCLTDSMG